MAPADRPGIDAAIAFATRRFGEDVTLADLANEAQMPENTLTRQFNRVLGMSPMRWLWRFRTLLAAELIAASPRASLTDVAMFCGFNSSAHFSRRFREVFAKSPSQYRMCLQAQHKSSKDDHWDTVCASYGSKITKTMAHFGELPPLV